MRCKLCQGEHTARTPCIAPRGEWAYTSVDETTPDDAFCAGCDDPLPRGYLCYVRAEEYYYCQPCAQRLFGRRAPHAGSDIRGRRYLPFA